MEEGRGGKQGRGMRGDQPPHNTTHHTAQPNQPPRHARTTTFPPTKNNQWLRVSSPLSSRGPSLVLSMLPVTRLSTAMLSATSSSRSLLGGCAGAAAAGAATGAGGWAGGGTCAAPLGPLLAMLWGSPLYWLVSTT